MKKKNIIITGGTGYIGQNLALSLSKDKKLKIAVIKRKKSIYPSKISKEKNILKFNYNGTILSLCNAFKKFKPDLIIHLAANVQTSHTSKNLKDIIDSNILFSTFVLEAMKICNIKNIINTGTYWQYHYKHYSPIALYAATKEAFEKILEFYVQNYDFKSISLILYDVYGSNDKRNKIINYLMINKDKDTCINLYGGEQLFYPIHINDVIKGFEVALNMIFNLNKPSHKKYTLKPNEIFKFKNFISIFYNSFDCSFKIKWSRNGNSQKRYLKDNKTLFSNLPKWSSKISIREGLKNLS